MLITIKEVFFFIENTLFVNFILSFCFFFFRTLADNSLHLIDPLTFYDLNKLKRLNLQNCGLKSLTAHAFQGLTNLISL